MPIVCAVDCSTSMTFGSWFKRDEFLSGTTNKGVNTLCMRRICSRKAAKTAVTWPDEILQRDDIQNATLFKTFQNKMLLCFKSGRNLGKN